VSAKGRSIETRIADALDVLAKSSEKMARDNAQHLAFDKAATERSEAWRAELLRRDAERFEAAREREEEAIRRSIELHAALMERHGQVTEAHELAMATLGVRCPDIPPDADEN
jgi:hypothetical protein